MIVQGKCNVMNTSFSCAVVGAGIAGLMAAKSLQAQGVKVIVVDKGRGVGGRLATRWVEASVNEKGYFDHGAQFFTVREARWQKIVDEWLAAGIVREWARGFAQGNELASHDGHPRFCGVIGMNAIAQYLARGLDVRCEHKVVAVRQNNQQWDLDFKNHESITTDVLLMTAPAEQSLALLEAGNYILPSAAQMALERIVYDPCFAVLAVLDAPSHLPEPGALQLQGEPIAWIADNHRKGISHDAYTITIHAGAEFTRQYWEAEHEFVAGKLLAAASAWLGGSVQSWQVHRWRYSQPRVVHPEACLLVNETAPLMFAGDGFGAPRVEGAGMSGLIAADKIVEVMSL